MLAPEIGLLAYEATPGRCPETPAEWIEGDVLLSAALFGNAPIEPPAGITVIEDHSHDPTGDHAHASKAHYAVASLRKTMPLPDGGVLWSPRDADLPAEVPTTPGHDTYSLLRLTAMALKQIYLAGGSVAHSGFRDLFVRSERGVWASQPSGISAFSRQRLASLPHGRFRERRAENLEAFSAAFGAPPGVLVFKAPFSVLAVFEDPALRDRVRCKLVKRRIYTSILWPLDAAAVPGITPSDHAFSERVMSIHADHRYGPKDMHRVAKALLAVLLTEGQR